MVLGLHVWLVSVRLLIADGMSKGWENRIHVEVLNGFPLGILSNIGILNTLF